MSGATQASGITLVDPLHFDEVVPLNSLRAVGTFHPPQSYRYLRDGDLRQVTERRHSPVRRCARLWANSSPPSLGGRAPSASRGGYGCSARYWPSREWCCWPLSC